MLPKDFDPAKKYPLLVEVHGGPASSVTSRWDGGAGGFSATTFSTLGYFVLLPNPRGSYGQGEAFTEANRRTGRSIESLGGAMQLQRARVGRLAVLLAVACATFGAMASLALAGGVPSRDSYTVNISPGSVKKDSSTKFDVAMTNTSSPGRTIGAAAITPPLGFRVTGASLPAGAKGRVYVLFNVVLLDRAPWPPGSTLHIAVTAIAPSRCDTHFTRWFTVATGGRFGELMFPDPSSSLTTDVTCANPAAGVDFVAQPTNSTVNQDITPPVTVQSSTPRATRSPPPACPCNWRWATILARAPSAGR